MSEGCEDLSSPAEEPAEWLEMRILRVVGRYRRTVSEIEVELRDYSLSEISDQIMYLVNRGYLTESSGVYKNTAAGLHQIYGDPVKRSPIEQSSAGVKHDQGKLRFDLLSVEALEGTAAALTYGAAKYADRNWEKGMAWGRPFRALLGHLFNHWRGEEIDAESGLPHIDLAACNMMFLQHYFKTKTGTDNRPKPQEK